MQPRTTFSFGLAILAASATLGYGVFAILSDNAVLASAQRLVIALIMPGLAVAILVTGMVDAHLFLGAAINALVYFGVGWFGYAVIARFRRRPVR